MKAVADAVEGNGGFLDDRIAAGELRRWSAGTRGVRVAARIRTEEPLGLI
jgi:hypothetical protein